MDSSSLTQGDPARVEIAFGVRIPMRDGVELAATLYRPKGVTAAVAAIFTLTPYLADSFHGAGVYFASHGFAFLSIDCRGRGNSAGEFRPNLADGVDGHDITEWLAVQPWCNGKVAMGGGSYSGWNQWATAGTHPPQLASIMPRCSSYPGVDWPIRNNIAEPYSLQWLTYVGGRTPQLNLFFDEAFWVTLWKARFIAGAAFNTLPHELGPPPPALAEWLAHPEADAHWDSATPAPADYAMMSLPVLTVTGIYDDDQQGSLAYYHRAMAHGSAAFRDANYLVIGPWDHFGVGAPQLRLGGLEFAPESRIDMRALSVDWYRWTMDNGPRPAFLSDRVAWYVTGREQWRYAASLAAVTDCHEHLYIGVTGETNSLASPGSLTATLPTAPATDTYVYDPRDTAIAELEASLPRLDPTEMRIIAANDGKQLVYQSTPFAADTEVSGFFSLDLWLSIDQPDTDFRVLVQSVAPDGGAILLTQDTVRARYRTGLRTPALITTGDPLLYRFDTFHFTSRLIRAGECLRLIIGPWNSIYTQKNYNSGGSVADEMMADARTVTVVLHSGGKHKSTLLVPLAARQTAEEQ